MFRLILILLAISAPRFVLGNDENQEKSGDQHMTTKDLTLPTNFPEIKVPDAEKPKAESEETFPSFGQSDIGPPMTTSFGERYYGEKIEDPNMDLSSAEDPEKGREPEPTPSASPEY